MKSFKQLLVSVACTVFIFGSFNAVAENEIAEKHNGDEFESKIASGENVVLFKIHDVTSVKNDDGVVTDCEFSLTLYNRSPKYIDGATIDLTWIDDGVSVVIDAEDKAEIDDVASGRDKVRQTKLPKTEKFVSKDLSTSIILPAIKPFRQVSLKSKIKSDRCFLLIQDVDYSFSSCNVSDVSGASDRNVNAAVPARRLAPMSAGGSSVSNECQSLFRFVSVKDPEYYREFQKVSFNEEMTKRQEARTKDMKELSDNYDKVIENLKDTVSVLEGIK